MGLCSRIPSLFENRLHGEHVIFIRRYLSGSVLYSIVRNLVTDDGGLSV